MVKHSKAQNSARVAWKREASDQDVTARIGQRIREYREKAALSLADASSLSGIPAATLSRIENNKMSPTFPVLLKLMTGLRLSWTDLIGSDATYSEQELSIASPDIGEPTVVPGYAYYVPHHANPLSEHLQPLLFDVIATDLESAGGLRGHEGYEFSYVLSGSVVFYVEGQEPRILKTGASVLFRSDVPHAYVSQGPGSARLLNVISLDPVILKASVPYSARYPEEK